MDGATETLFRGKTTILQPAPELGTIEARGSEVRSWLNGLVTCDLVPRKVGEGAFGLCAGKTGKIVAEVYIALLEEERFLIGLRRAAVDAVMEHFDRHLVMEDVEIVNASDAHVWSFLHGAPARSYADVVAGAGGRLLPLDFTGMGSCAVLSSGEAASAVLGAIAAHGGDSLLVANEDDWHVLRVERGVPWYGHDFDESSYAQEAALERFGVSFTKGCYLGQEAVFMLQVRGHVKKRLVQLAIEGDVAVEKGTPIALPDGTVTGAVTSAAPVEGGRRLVLGHVKYKVAKPGEEFVVGGVKAVATEVIPAPKE